MNTYDWIIATADSNINNKIWTIIKILIIIKFIEGPVFPNKVRSKCPAIILAVNRTAKVPGRITFLIVSIHTIKGNNTLGAPCGTKCANIWFVLLSHPNNIKDNHKGKDKDKVIIKCLDLVKI